MRNQLIRFFSLVSFLMIYTAYKACLLWPVHRTIAIGLTIPLFILMIGGTFIYRAHPKVYEERWYRGFVWIGSLTLGWWGTFVILSIPLDILYLITDGYDEFMGIDLSDDSRTIQLFRYASLGILVISGIFDALGFLEVLRGPSVKEVWIPMQNLHPDLQNLKIVQMSDLHVGPTIRKSYVDEVVKRVNAIHADLIFMTGDIADARAESIIANLAPLSQLESKLGIFYVTGNHEYYWGAEEIISELSRLHLKPLLNANQVIQIGSAKLLVAGVTDPMGARFISSHRSDVKKAIQTNETTQLKVLLAHRPGTCVESEAAGFDLQLSGHTHAGQFFPFSLLVGLVHRYFQGLNRHGRLWVYVNPGTGYWGPANRFQVTPEITLIRLKKAEEHV